VNDALTRALAPRGGPAATVAAVVRVVAGVALLLIGIGKFADHMKEAVDFEHYGVPLPDLAVWVSGTIEVVGGALLVLGLLTRLAAALVAVNLIVAIATAGVMEGGTFHLGVGPALLLAMLFLLWAGGGAWSLDGRLAAGAAVHRTG
jgi:putative oxidoreductase